MIADTIPLAGKTNEERGFPEDSFYIIEFEDGSKRDEHDTNWSAFAEIRTVDYFGKKKQVSISKLPIRKIKVFHGKLTTEIEVPENCEVYQAFYSETTFIPNGKRFDNLNGRCVGLVKDGQVVEERFLNARQQEILGIRL